MEKRFLVLATVFIIFEQAAAFITSSDFVFKHHSNSELPEVSNYLI